jgi:putative serine protease PepD
MTGVAVSVTSPTTPSSDDTNALHFAQPADYLWDIATQLADTGQIVRPWIGLGTGQDLTADEAEENDVLGGVTVSRVDSGSPAALAKIKDTDIITGIDDVNILSYNDLVVATRRLKPGDQVTVVYLRDGEKFTPTFTVASRTEAP